MLNGLWAGMLLIGIIWGMMSGQTEAVGKALIESGGEAVSLCITMCGIVGMWCGMMKIAEESGLISRLTAMLKPVLRFLFPRLPVSHPAQDAISMNLIANILGLGWAATPAGLKAMEDLAALQRERGEPSDTAGSEMCTFLVLNISSLQLLPVNMIAYRAQYHSPSPAAIVGPAILATAVSTLAAVVFCLIGNQRDEKSGRFSAPADCQSPSNLL